MLVLLSGSEKFSLLSLFIGLRESKTFEDQALEQRMKKGRTREALFQTIINKLFHDKFKISIELR